VVQVLGEPAQVNPTSTVQSDAQPSPGVEFPSSHCSVPVTKPSPQTGLQTLGEPVQE